MIRLSSFLIALCLATAVIGGLAYTHAPTQTGMADGTLSRELQADRKIIYYRDPSGAPFFSATPKKDDQGRDYVPVYEDEEESFNPEIEKRKGAQSGPRKVLYYRNPMGLPDTSPTPKKDWMGMDYIAVYEDEDQDDGKTVKISLDKIQRSGVRTEHAEARVLVTPIRGVGTVKVDERRIHIVALRFDGYVEELFVNATGQFVKAGERLFRVYSRELQLAQVDLVISPGTLRTMGDRSVDGAMQRLRNLGVPESRIIEVVNTGTNIRTIDWPSPVTGTIVDKRVVSGQQFRAGEELFRIVDLSRMWIIAEVAESELSYISLGTPTTITLRAYPHEEIEGSVSFIYPDVRTETRTGRIRIELPNPNGRLKTEMYADVVFKPTATEGPVVVVPDSAVIDSGSRQIVLVAKGNGRFEPRRVKLGRHGEGYVEIVNGLQAGDEIVTGATFLIDAESNLRAALQAFSRPESPR